MKADNLVKLRDMQEFNIPNFVVFKGPVEELDLSYLKDNVKYAVRSSCYLEDTEGSSCAGQFSTFLNVDKSDVLDKINLVMESYNGYGGDVIVQEMIDSELSGVVFTSNPNGMLNEAVIVVGKGLGDNIVEDRVDTSTYYYHLEDKIYYTEDNDILTKELISELVNISIKIRDKFNNHMDIEFAIKDNKIYILQARPITTIDRDAEVILLDNSNIVESYPGISLPLTQDFVKEVYYKVFRSLVLRITTDKELVDRMDLQLRDMTDICNGRIYYRISNWYNVLNLLPFSSKIIPIWQDMLGVHNKEVKTTSDVKLSTKIKVTKQFINLIITSPKKMELLNSYFSEQIKEYRLMINNCESINQLLNTYDKLMSELTDVWDITLVNDMYTFLFTALSGENGKKELANIKNLESMKPVIELNNLVKIYSIQKESNFFLDKEKEYIENYGDRCLEELKLETKTYKTNPELLREYIRQAEVLNLSNNEEDKTKDTFFIKRAKIGIYNREISRMNRSRIYGLARDIMLRIGEEYKKYDLIDEVDDIFYLRKEELHKQREVKQLVKERKQEIEMCKLIPSYSRLEFSETIKHKRMTKSNIKLDNSNSELIGVASSLGKVTGEVILIDSPNINIDTNNKIIVTKTTDPGWVFLIKNSLGIIAEKGSMLSHTAIITRELKKPSVVNVKDATKILKTGDTVELDAINGIIKVIQ